MSDNRTNDEITADIQGSTIGRIYQEQQAAQQDNVTIGGEQHGIQGGTHTGSQRWTF
jgi:hypothetical protein